MISTNAAGARTVRYGSVRPWVDAVELVTADGDRLRLARGVEPPAVAAPALRAGRRSRTPCRRRSDPRGLSPHAQEFLGLCPGCVARQRRPPRSGDRRRRHARRGDRGGVAARPRARAPGRAPHRARHDGPVCRSDRHPPRQPSLGRRAARPDVSEPGRVTAPGGRGRGGRRCGGDDPGRARVE